MKFLADAMLGKLARILRIFGYDVIYANDLEEYFKLAPVPDDKLKDYAEESKRIIITKDLPFFNRIKDKGIYLEGEGVYNYLYQLKAKFNLKFEFDLYSARCSVCNHLLKKVADKNSIQDKVQADTFNYYDVFVQCINPLCKKVYWKGTHIEDILKILKEFSP